VARSPSPRARAPGGGLSALCYTVEIADPHAHLYRVSLSIPSPAARQRVSLPVWIPGSYLVREFSRHLQSLDARQGTQSCAVRSVDKCSWDIDADPARSLDLSWEVYAFDASVRAAWLDSQRAFFNGTSLCLRAHGFEGVPIRIRVTKPAFAPKWRLATALAPVRTDARGFGTYVAADYDELVDSPFEVGTFWEGRFDACGVPHRFVVAGATAAFDGDRLINDARRICEAAIRFWHPRSRPPHRDYLFLLNAVDDGYGGLEHRQSTALICARKDLPRRGDSRAVEGYTTLLGLISHEYFHTWNVKRLRPIAFARYDYAAENYTDQLWFFEGFTSYYDDLLLLRAGLIDAPGYLRLLNKTINQVLQTPGRLLQSVAQASRDAWIRYYRPDENTPNTTVSYYTKGALVALCLDLRLRDGGTATLDQIMRALWKRCRGGPMDEADLLSVLADLGAPDVAASLREWVHGTAELPLHALLTRHGVQVHEDAAQWAQRLGLRMSEEQGLRIKSVLRGGAAEKAGFAPGDEWIAVAERASSATTWRLQRVDDLPLYVGAATRLTAWIARDRRMLELPLDIPADETTWRLSWASESPASGQWPHPG
jgi:predicted metalloprotease with PDZ domain